MIARPNTSQADRDVIEDLGLADADGALVDSSDPAAVHDDEPVAS